MDHSYVIVYFLIVVQLCRFAAVRWFMKEITVECGAHTHSYTTESLIRIVLVMLRADEPDQFTGK